MDWSRAKTIFIITFLILDIFLFIQLIHQKNRNTFDLLKETSIEEQLLADEIKVGSLPEEPKKESYVEADSKIFTKEDLSSLKDQSITIENGNLLKSVLSKPYPLKENWNSNDVNQFVQTHILNGANYTLWNMNKEEHTITYYQGYNNKLFYKNNGGKIEIQLNNKNEIVSYTQTMLEDIKEIKEQEIITAHEAMVILYKKRLLKSGSNITNVSLGYYTLTPVMSSQLLTPTWRFKIEGQEDLFVNAVEGHVIQITDDEDSQIVE